MGRQAGITVNQAHGIPRGAVAVSSPQAEDKPRQQTSLRHGSYREFLRPNQATWKTIVGDASKIEGKGDMCCCEVCDATVQRGREPDDGLGDYAKTSGAGRGGERTGEAAARTETATEAARWFDTGGGLAGVIFLKIVVKGDAACDVQTTLAIAAVCKTGLRALVGLECE